MIIKGTSTDRHTLINSTLVVLSTLTIAMVSWAFNEGNKTSINTNEISIIKTSDILHDKTLLEWQIRIETKIDKNTAIENRIEGKLDAKREQDADALYRIAHKLK